MWHLHRAERADALARALGELPAEPADRREQAQERLRIPLEAHVLEIAGIVDRDDLERVAGVRKPSDQCKRGEYSQRLE